MDEDIEALWIDREMSLIHGSVFDEVTWASSEASDFALDAVEGSPDPDGRVARVVVSDPSDRVIGSHIYFNVGSVLQRVGAGRRLVLGPAAVVDDSPLAVALDACETYAAILRNVIGTADGSLDVRVMTGAEAKRDDGWLDTDLRRLA